MNRARELASRIFWGLHSATWDRWTLQAEADARAARTVTWVRDLGVAAGASVLDAGCATGAISLALASGGFPVVGVDVSEAMLRRARRRVASGGPRVEFHRANLEGRLPFGDGAFGAVVCSQTAQCVRDLPRLWAELQRVLQPGGVLAIEARLPGVACSPARGSLAARAFSPVKRWASQAAVHVPPEEMAAQLRRAGYQDVRCASDGRVARVSGRAPARP